MRCKPGDLAVVIGGSRTLENVGRIVSVVRFVEADQRFVQDGATFFPDRGGWLVRFCGGKGVSVYRKSNRTVSNHYGIALDEYLMPLPGDAEIIEQEKTKEAA